MFLVLYINYSSFGLIPRRFAGCKIYVGITIYFKIKMHYSQVVKKTSSNIQVASQSIWNYLMEEVMYSSSQGQLREVFIKR